MFLGAFVDHGSSRKLGWRAEITNDLQKDACLVMRPELRACCKEFAVAKRNMGFSINGIGGPKIILSFYKLFSGMYFFLFGSLGSCYRTNKPKKVYTLLPQGSLNGLVSMRTPTKGLPIFGDPHMHRNPHGFWRALASVLLADPHPSDFLMDQVAHINGFMVRKLYGDDNRIWYMAPSSWLILFLQVLPTILDSSSCKLRR